MSFRERSGSMDAETSKRDGIMRRIFCSFTVVLFLLTALFPACRAAAATFGYEVELTGAPVFLR